MQFTVEPAIFARFPGMQLAIAVARGIDNTAERPGVQATWEEAWQAAQEAAVYGNSQSHPRVRPWRERFQAAGISPKKYPSSIEALLRRALKGGQPFYINPLVDFYNAISLRHVAPAGAFDLAAIDAGLALRLTSSGDHFQALDEDHAEPLPAGEVAYASGQTILTRHFVWRQARTGLVTPATQDVFLVAEVLGELGPQVTEAVLRDFEHGLRSFFQVAPQLFIVDERTPAISW